MIKTNKVYNENCLKTIESMPNNFIQSIITSPPYFNLRDYGTTTQIGIESNFNEYLDNIVNVFSKAKRVLKKDGIVFVNIGDTYASKNIGSIKRKTLLGIPDRFKILMIDNGWICRSDIIWHKPNAMPSSAKDRFVNDYERVFMFTKNEKYKFNTQYEDRKTIPSRKTTNTNKSKYLNEEQEKSVRQGMSKKRGSKLLEKRNNLPERLLFVNFIRSKTTAKKIFEECKDIKLSKLEHWFRKDEGGFSYPKVSDWVKVRDFIDDWSDTFFNIDKGNIQKI